MRKSQTNAAKLSSVQMLKKTKNLCMYPYSSKQCTSYKLYKGAVPIKAKLFLVTVNNALELMLQYVPQSCTGL